MEKAINIYRYKYKALVKKDRIFILFSAIAFFIGQAVFFSFANPFFAPFLSLFLGKSNLIFMLMLVPLILGASLSFNGVFLYTYTFIGLLLLLFNTYINNQKIRISEKTRSICCGISVLFGGFVPVIIYNMSTYFLAYFLIFSLASGIIAKMFQYGFSIITFEKNINYIKINEIVGFSVLICAILIGVLNLNISVFNLYFYIAMFISLLISVSSMKNNTVTFAFIVSVIPYITNSISANEMIILIFLAFSTLIVMDNDKKLVVSSVFIAMIISYLYIDKTFFIQRNVLAILLAMLTFLLIPNGFYEQLQSKYGLIDNSFYPYSNKLKQFSNITLSRYSRTFNNLANIFYDIAKVDNILTENDLETILENSKDKICIHCRNYSMCFIETTYTTKSNIKQMTRAIETNNKLLYEQQYFTFSKICLKTDEFLKILNIYIDVCKSEIKHKNNLEEYKILVAHQLKEISKIFLSIKDDVSNNITFLPKYEKQLINVLSILHIYPTKVMVTKNNNHIFNIYISVYLGVEEKEVLKVITNQCCEITNKKIKLSKNILLDNGISELVFEEVAKFDINFGVAFKKEIEAEMSGDSYSTIHLSDQKVLLAISDGMGKGKEASALSTLTLDLYEEFLESGFDRNIAIDLINSSLILKNTKDSFATIDSAIIDLYTGDSEFIKIGAVQSFILRDKDVLTISSKSLPIGIVKNIETKVYRKQLKHNDYVILVSDGVLDVISVYTNQDVWIKTTLKAFKGSSAKSLAEYIIEEALIVSKNRIKDDMTVAVGKIIEV